MEERIYKSYGEVDSANRSVVNPVNDLGRNYNYKGLLEGGLDWLLEPFAVLQERSFSAFRDCARSLNLGIVMIYNPLYEVWRPVPVLFVDCAGKMIQVEPCFVGDTYEEGNDCFGSLLSLPDALAKSWLWRTGGWRVPSEPFQGPLINRGLIGHPSSQWKVTDGFLDSLGKGFKRKYMPGLLERFPDMLTKTNGIKRYCLEAFLDTRLANKGGPVGDQFFVLTTRTDQTVYHVHQGDVGNLRVLHDPADAIDRYCAHVLRNKDGEFDFSPWSELLT